MRHSEIKLVLKVDHMFNLNEKVYKIKAAEQNGEAMRKSVELIIMMFCIFLVVFFLPILFVAGADAFKIIPKMFPFIFIICGIMFVMFFSSNSNYFKAYRLAINNAQMIQFSDLGDLSFMNKMGQARNQQRSGQNATKYISFGEINEIVDKKHKLRVRTYNYSYWNGNGQIDIPKGLENYDEVLAILKSKVAPRKFN